MREMRLKYICTSSSTTLAKKDASEMGEIEVYGADGKAGYINGVKGAEKEYLGIIKDGAGVGRISIYPPKSVLIGTMASIFPNDEVSISWLKYAIEALDLGKGNDNTTIPHIYFSEYGNKSIWYVEREHQDRIARYLDKKAGQIDSLISNVQSQIENLKAYKQSLITEVVTKGLDPTVPMKESGVEWIGEIPAHWEITRIKNKFELRNERNDEADLSKVNLISLYTDLGVVQHSDLTETTGNRAVTAEGYKIVHKNDIVVNIILCWMGAVGMSKYDGVTSPAYDIYCPLGGTLSEYYHYLFRTPRFNGECYRYGRGIMMMRWRTYSTEFRSITIPCPPVEEQHQIIGYLNKKCAEIDRLIAIKQQKIEKLNDYKKSLIYEYVTGKKEVM